MRWSSIGASSLLLTAVACAEPEPLLGVGDAFPAVPDHVLSRAAELVWVVGRDDLFACRSAADAIRDMQRLGTLAIPVTVVGTDRDDWTRALVRKHRLRATIVSVPTLMGMTRTHDGGGSVYLLRHGRIAAVAPASDTAGLQQMVRRHAAVPGDAPAPHPQDPGS
jgi:hypothetical protein